MKTKDLWVALKKSKKAQKKSYKIIEQAGSTFESLEWALRKEGIVCGTMEEIRIVCLCNLKKKSWKEIQWLKIPFYE